MDAETANGIDNVTLLDSGFGSGRVLNDVPGGDPTGGVHPGDAVVGEDEAGTLLEVEDRKDHGRHGQQGQNDRTKPHSEAIDHLETPVSSART